MMQHLPFAEHGNTVYEVVVEYGEDIAIRSLTNHDDDYIAHTDHWMYLSVEDARNLVDALTRILRIDDKVIEREVSIDPDTREWLDRPNTAWVQIDFGHNLTVSDLSRLLDVCRVTDEIPYFDPYTSYIEIGCIPDAESFKRIREAVDSIQDRAGRRGAKVCRLVVEYDGDEEDEDSEPMTEEEAIKTIEEIARGESKWLSNEFWQCMSHVFEKEAEDKSVLRKYLNEPRCESYLSKLKEESE